MLNIYSRIPVAQPQQHEHGILPRSGGPLSQTNCRKRNHGFTLTLHVEYMFTWTCPRAPSLGDSTSTRVWWGWSSGSSGGCPSPCTSCSRRRPTLRRASTGGRPEPSRLRRPSPGSSQRIGVAGVASPSWPRLASSWIERSGPAGARQTLARHGPRQTSTLLLMLTSARPPTRAWEVARTVVAPPLSVVKCLWEVFVLGSCRARVCAGVGGVFSVGVSCVRVTC